MSEEEMIISSIKPIVNARKTHQDNNLYSLQLNAYQLDMIQGLLDLYNKEKEKNKELFETCCRYEEKLGEYETTDAIFLDKYFNLDELRKEDEIGIKGKRYISKDKIKAILNKYRFCKIERLKELYKEVQELLEEKER